MVDDVPTDPFDWDPEDFSPEGEGGTDELKARIVILENALRDARRALSRTILSSINGKAEVDAERWNTLVRADITEIDNILGDKK